MRERILAEKLAAWEYMKYLMSLDQEGLKICGHRSTQEALAQTMSNSIMKIEKMIREAEKEI